MCIDFRKNQRCPKPVYIKGETVERVDTYKYLGVVFDSKLNWKEIINAVLNWRMYCTRKLRSFGINSDMLVTFYNVVLFSQEYIFHEDVCTEMSPPVWCFTDSSGQTHWKLSTSHN